MVSSYFTNPSQAGRDKTFQSDKYRTEIKPQEFGGDKFTLDTILEDGKLVTVVSVWKDTTGRRDYSFLMNVQYAKKNYTVSHLVELHKLVNYQNHRGQLRDHSAGCFAANVQEI